MVCLRRCRKTTCRGGVESACCPGTTLPTTLTGTVSSVTPCTCNVTVGDSFTVDWSVGYYEKTGINYIACGVYARLTCVAGPTWDLDITSDRSTNTPTLVSFTCDPLEIVFDVAFSSFDVAGCCGTPGMCSGTWRVVFTA